MSFIPADNTFVAAPHFDVPFRLSGSKFAEVEQDTIEDVYNCVWASLVTEEGFRPESPDFGTPDLALTTQPLPADLIIGKILQDEPRAQLILDQQPDAFDGLIADVTINVQTGSGG